MIIRVNEDSKTDMANKQQIDNKVSMQIAQLNCERVKDSEIFFSFWRIESDGPGQPDPTRCTLTANNH